MWGALSHHKEGCSSNIFIGWWHKRERNLRIINSVRFQSSFFSGHRLTATNTKGFFVMPRAEVVGFPAGSMVKNPPAKQETWVQSLGWKIPWRRNWQPTSVCFWDPMATVHGVPKELDMTEWLNNNNKGRGRGRQTSKTTKGKLN